MRHHAAECVSEARNHELHEQQRRRRDRAADERDQRRRAHAPHQDRDRERDRDDEVDAVEERGTEQDPARDRQHRAARIRRDAAAEPDGEPAQAERDRTRPRKGGEAGGREHDHERDQRVSHREPPTPPARRRSTRRRRCRPAGAAPRGVRRRGRRRRACRGREDPEAARVRRGAGSPGSGSRREQPLREDEHEALFHRRARAPEEAAQGHEQGERHDAQRDRVALGRGLTRAHRLGGASRVPSDAGSASSAVVATRSVMPRSLVPWCRTGYPGPGSAVVREPVWSRGEPHLHGLPAGPPRRCRRRRSVPARRARALPPGCRDRRRRRCRRRRQARRAHLGVATPRRHGAPVAAVPRRDRAGHVVLRNRGQCRRAPHDAGRRRRRRDRERRALGLRRVRRPTGAARAPSSSSATHRTRRGGGSARGCSTSSRRRTRRARAGLCARSTSTSSAT